MIDWLIEHWVKISVYSAIVSIGIFVVIIILIICINIYDKYKWKKLLKK